MVFFLLLFFNFTTHAQHKSLDRTQVSKIIKNELITSPDFKDAFLKARAKELLPFCKNYKEFSNSQKLNFWTFFLTELAQLESWLRVDLTQQVDVYKAPNRYAIGLFQITPKIATKHGCLKTRKQQINNFKKKSLCSKEPKTTGCLKSPTRQLSEPDTNARCAVKIVSSLIRKQVSYRSPKKSYIWKNLRATKNSRPSPLAKRTLKYCEANTNDTYVEGLRGSINEL